MEGKDCQNRILMIQCANFWRDLNIYELEAALSPFA